MVWVRQARGGNLVRTPLTYKEAKKSKNVRGKTKLFSFQILNTLYGFRRFCSSPFSLSDGQVDGCRSSSKGSNKNVVNDRSIYFLGLFRKAFQHRLCGTALSSGIGIFFREMPLYESEERLLRIGFSPCSLRLSSYGPQDRKPSSCESSSTLECTSKTLDRRAKSFPCRIARNTAAPLDFFP